MTKKATNSSTTQGDVYVDEYFKVHWRVLPTKANQEMEQAGADAAREYLERNGHNNLWVIYEAMTAAAPTPPHFEDEELSALLPKPEDDSELPVVGEAIYDAWDMAQQWNGCRENFLPIVMRLQAERNVYRDALRVIGEGVAVAYGEKNHSKINEEIFALQTRDLDQLAMLLELREHLAQSRYVWTLKDKDLWDRLDQMIKPTELANAPGADT